MGIVDTGVHHGDHGAAAIELGLLRRLYGRAERGRFGHGAVILVRHHNGGNAGQLFDLCFAAVAGADAEAVDQKAITVQDERVLVDLHDRLDALLLRALHLLHQRLVLRGLRSRLCRRELHARGALKLNDQLDDRILCDGGLLFRIFDGVLQHELAHLGERPVAALFRRLRVHRPAGDRQQDGQQRAGDSFH